MRDMSFDWCFEGGCSYVNDALEDEMDIVELEMMYAEPCMAMAD